MIGQWGWKWIGSGSSKSVLTQTQKYFPLKNNHKCASIAVWRSIVFFYGILSKLKFHPLRWYFLDYR